MKEKYRENPSLMKVTPPPETPLELVNKYGRCNVQGTCDTENEYPQIAQGLAKTTPKKHRGEK